MNGFIKTTFRKLSGVQKAAILLAEIGPLHNTNFSALEKALNLKPEEVARLNAAYKSLPAYNKDFADSEIQVLNEALNYGQIKGIYKFSEKNQNSEKKSVAEEFAKNNPKDMAQILGRLLKE